MNKKELKRLNRKQLLELLLIQIERADDLERRLEEAEAELQSKELVQMQAGNLAEAALKLSGIFEAAQEAADLYLQNVQRQAENRKEILSAGGETEQWQKKIKALRTPLFRQKR